MPLRDYLCKSCNNLKKSRGHEGECWKQQKAKNKKWRSKRRKRMWVVHDEKKDSRMKCWGSNQLTSKPSGWEPSTHEYLAHSPPTLKERPSLTNNKYCDSHITLPGIEQTQVFPNLLCWIQMDHQIHNLRFHRVSCAKNLSIIMSWFLTSPNSEGLTNGCPCLSLQ